MAVEHFGNCISRRKVYGLVERFKGGLVYTPSGRPLTVALVMVKEEVEQVSGATEESALMKQHAVGKSPVRMM
jgi:hypothetical protein